MKKYRLAFCALIFTILIVPVIAEFNNKNNTAISATTQGNRKTSVSQYEKVILGNHTLTAIDGSLKFLSDNTIGNAITWSEANTAATNWKTTSGFTTREQAFITSKLGSRADLPINSEILNSNIPTSTANWWLSDATLGDGTPKSFVDKTNGVDTGYKRPIGANIGGVCGTSQGIALGGLNTVAYLGPKPVTAASRSHYFMMGGTDNQTPEKVTYEFYKKPDCSDDMAFSLTASKTDEAYGTGIVFPVPATLEESLPLEGYSKDFYGPDFNLSKGEINVCKPLAGTAITSSPADRYDTGWGMKIQIEGAPPPEVIKPYTYISYFSIVASAVDCPAVSVPVSLALTRPVVTLAPSSIFSLTTTPSMDVSSDGVLGAYPDAGVGPYTLQVVEPNLKVKLDTSDGNVSGNVVKYRDDAIQDGKITIPYDMSGSAYETDSTTFVSAIVNGNYAKLGSVTKNGKGSVVLDINDLATKTDGVITPQDIGVELYQEEMTPSGKTNYISSPYAMTIRIIPGKVAQTPLVISNSDHVTYGENNNKISIQTTGGSGTGALSYAITSGSDVATINTTTGEVNVLKPGVITVKATKATDETYLQSVASKEITIDKAPQTGFAITNGDFIIRKNATTFQIETTARIGELTSPLQYTLVSDGDGAATMNNSGLVSVNKAGTIKVSVTSLGNVNYEDTTVSKEIVLRDLPAQSPSLTITNSDTIAYNDNGNKFIITTVGGQGSGNITYEITAGNDVATVDQASKTVSILKVGTFTLKATKSGGNDYLDSVATLEITVKKAKQEPFQITNLDTYLIDTNPTIQVTTNMKPENVLGKLTYTLTGEAFASIDTNGLITTKDAGTFTIKVTSPGNEFYEEAQSDVKTIVLTKRVAQNPLVITPPGKLVYSKNMKFQAITSGGQGSGAKTFSISNGLNTVATINESTGDISVVKPGTFTLHAKKAADNTYLESIATPIEVIVDKMSQDRFDVTTTEFVMKDGATTFQIETTGREADLTSDLVYALVNDGGGAATMSTTGEVTAKKPGIIEVRVTSLGNDFYEDKIVTKNIEIKELPLQNPPLSITNKTTRAYGEDGNRFTIVTDGGQGSGTIQFSITSGNDVATVDQATRTITVLKVGTFTIKAVQDGAGQYQDSIATQTITVTKADQNDFRITNEDFLLNSQSNFEIATTGRPAELTSAFAYDITLGKGDIANLSGKVVTPINVGEITLSVTSIGNENYNNKVATKTIKITDLPEQPLFTITNSRNMTYDPANTMLTIQTDGGASDAGPITYQIQNGNSFAEITDETINKVNIIKPGTFGIIATKNGAGKYKDSVATIEITVNKMLQENLAITNGNFIMDSGANFPVTIEGLPSDLTKNIAYDIIDGKGTVATISNDIITPLKPGNLTISATSYGNDFYETKTITKTIKITELPHQNPELSILNSETMTFNPLKTTFKMQVEGGQGDGVVSYEMIEGRGTIANINGDIVNIIKPGTFTIKATKAGKGIYKDSVDEIVILVHKAQQSDFTITNRSFMLNKDANRFAIETTGRPSECTTPITYAIVEDMDGIASLEGNEITVTKSGTIKVSATSKGNENYEDKTALATIVIEELPDQTPLQITNPSTLKYGDNNNTFTLSTTGGSSDSNVVYELKTGGDVATLTGANITIQKVGSFSVIAKKDGNGTHKDVQTEKSFTVGKGIQKDLQITNTNVQFVPGATFPITISGRPQELQDELVSSLLIGDGTVATLQNHIITPLKVGTIEIQVVSPGNANYDDKTISKTIEITALPIQDPPLVINNVATRPYDPDANVFDINASGGAEDAGVITYDILVGKDTVASISGKKVTVLKPGKFTIQAKRAGGSTYQDSIATLEITVTKMLQQNFEITNTDFILDSQPTFSITTSGRPESLSEELLYSLSEGEGSIATLSGNIVTPIKEGFITIAVTSKGNEFYAEKTAMKQIRIKKLPLQPNLQITNSNTMTYDPNRTTFDIITTGGASDAGAIKYEVLAGHEFVNIADETKAKVSIVKPGTFTIQATKDGAGKYQDSVATLEITLNKASQNSFQITNESFTIKKDVTSFRIVTSGRAQGLNAPLTYAIVKDENAIATLKDDEITVQDVGEITISATSLGNDFYEDITVEKTIVIEDLPDQTPPLQIQNTERISYDEDAKTVALQLQGGQGNGALSYTITSGNDVASIDDAGNFTYHKLGSFEVEVIKSGGDVYKDSTVKKSFVVEAGEQKNFVIETTDFIFGSKPNFAIMTNGKPMEVTEPIVYALTLGEGTIATIEGNIITPITTGMIEISATSPASDHYQAKTVSKRINITQLPAQTPEIVITNDDITWGDQGNRMNLTYSGGQGNGAVTYSIIAGNDVATNDGSSVTILKTGTFRIHIKKSGNGVYQDSEATKEITVKKKDIDITPNPIRKNVGQYWASVSNNGFTINPALVSGDTLLGSANYAYGSNVDDTSPAGNYKVTMSGFTHPNYNIHFKEGDLKVEKVNLSPAKDYFKVASGTLGKNGWYTSDVVLTSLNKDGYHQLSDSLNFQGKNVTIQTEGKNNLSLYLKNINGSISEPIAYELKIDKTKPVLNDLTLTEKNTGAIANFINKISFGNWFNQEIEVRFEASDNMKGTITYLYQEEQNGVLSEWKSTSSNRLVYGDGTNLKVHVKAVDEAGNESADTKVSELIQIDVHKPTIEGVESKQSYYLPRLVKVQDRQSKLDLENTYYTIGEDKKALTETTLFNVTGDVVLHVQDNAGNEIESTFTIAGLPPIDQITDSDTSRKIVSDVEKEYEEIRDHLSDPLRRQEIEEWIKNAKEQSKKRIVKVEEPKTGIIVDGEGNVHFDDDVELVVEVVTTEIKAENIVLKDVSGIDEKDEIKEAYDIYLKKGDTRVQPNGTVKVKIPYTDQLKSYENIKVIYIDDKLAATLYPITLEGDYITFKTTHFSDYAIVGKKSPLNVDSDDDKIPDINIDINKDGKPELNVDIDDDGIPDLNIDCDFDGEPDFNIDRDKDGKADVNIIVPIKEWKPNVCGKFNDVEYCSNNELSAYLNIDTDHDGLPDLNVDINGDLEPEFNIDTDDDLIPNTDIDTDGDGKADINIDVNGDGIADKELASTITSWKPNKNCEANGFQYDTDKSIKDLRLPDKPKDEEDVVKPGGNNGGTSNGGNNVQKPPQEGVGGSIASEPTGDETDWTRWWVLLGTSFAFMQGSRMIRKRMQKNQMK